ncbi:unnamed protein product [Parnassius apollo]|uniref:(apollo) hypothetical protein n=1 Tax=Parnassius apollo TaxID=110799 RepID=A0A8S3X540_PARAO|nr:unnamed protein product [Parnassius apollo]
MSPILLLRFIRKFLLFLEKRALALENAEPTTATKTHYKPVVNVATPAALSCAYSQHRDTESNMQPTFNTESDDSHDTLIRKRKKEQVHKEKDLSAVDRRMIQFIDSMQKEEKKTDDSRIMSFFKSIAPTIVKFSDDEVVEFQYQVISILRNFKQRNINSNTRISKYTPARIHPTSANL